MASTGSIRTASRTVMTRPSNVRTATSRLLT